MIKGMVTLVLCVLGFVAINLAIAWLGSNIELVRGDSGDNTFVWALVVFVPIFIFGPLVVRLMSPFQGDM